jgi:hypothetical protein
MSTTITITLDNGVAVIGNDDISTEKPIKIKSKKKNSRPHLAVSNEELLQKILNAGLIGKMHGVNFIDGRNVYFFSVDENVKAIIDGFDNNPTETVTADQA